ncbi:restriction endonuclease subunit S [Boudabousia marimammalium]|uniref:Type I restriction modification DNA specificity domain-containing protein n=1 Tax=Boudabousia marimammalium TaxID=156892 RepID=A0A1Q5PJW8_9ACTO|nr:restriction endonuclease subunit S [Boudabousia marimammalium]OKL46226.1 hypothetical protein BM477_07285 [Boudabousia marimammalium]
MSISTPPPQVPALRFKGFTNPWQQQLFSDIAKIRRGLTYRPSDVQSEGVRVLRSSNIIEDTFTLHDDDVTVTKESVTIECVKSGDILITSANGSNRLVGKHAIINGLARDSAIHGGFMLAATASKPYFVNSLLSSPWYTEFINTHVLGGNGAIGNLSKRDLENQQVYAPTGAEQLLIGETYKHLDLLISQTQRKYEKLTELKQAMLEKMFPREGETVPELRFPGFTEPWTYKSLGDNGTAFGGLSGKSKADFGHGEGRYITYTNVFDNAIADPNRTEPIEIDDSQHQIKYGDILFTVSSEVPEEVGMSCVWVGNQEHLYLNSFCFSYRHAGQFNPYFMAPLLRSSSFRKKIVLLAQGISRFNISKAKVMQIEIPIPSMAEQQAIGQFFKTLDERIEFQSRRVDKLKELKQALLEKMFV